MLGVSVDHVTPNPYRDPMLCLACGVCVSNRKTSVQDATVSFALCKKCDHSLRPAPVRRLESGLRVGASFAHEGAAKRLVHRLKYDAVAGLARELAEAMAPLVPPDALVLVPVPRAIVRRVRYGVDQSVLLAKELGRIVGLPSVRLLRSPVWRPPHAGHGRNSRRAQRFRLLSEAAAGGILLIDDVVTTGTTLESAAAAAGGGVVGSLAFTMSISVTTEAAASRAPSRSAGSGAPKPAPPV